MREAGVNLVSVGIFSWALLETSEGVFDFVVARRAARPAPRERHLRRPRHPDRVAAGVVLRRPPRGARDHPRRHRDGLRLARHGIALVAGVPRRRSCASPRPSPSATRSIPPSCSGTCTTSTACRSARTTPSSRCTPGASGCRSATARLDDLNRAWGTAFWGQHYGKWEHIGAPAAAPSVVNPAQRLDFARFTDHQLRECFIAERDAIRAHASQPITTNFMANQSWTTDLWAWAREVDIVSDDHYLWAADPEGEIGLAIAADLSRSVGGGKPWILMEHSTSAVNWQPRNIAKRPGEMARNSLSHLGRGADAHPLLPVARIALRCREVPLRDAPPRRHRLARLARGRRARRHARPPRRGARVARGRGRRDPVGLRVVLGAGPRVAPVRGRHPRRARARRSTSGAGATASPSTSRCPARTSRPTGS